MDQLDTQILKLLKQDGRKSNLSIAKEVGVSEGSIRKRLLKLKESGVIQRFTIQTKNAVGAILNVKTAPEIATSEISKQIKSIGALRVFEVAGRYEIVCYIQAESLQEINDYVEQIRAINGVKETQTLPVLKEDWN